MGAIVMGLWVALTAAGAAADDNPVLTEMVVKGVAMPDGSVIKLPAPTMSEGMDAMAQAAAITQVAAPRTLEMFIQKSSSAPLTLKIRTVKSQGDATFRAVNLWFVAHGDWDTLVSDKFADGLAKTKEKEEKEKADDGGGALLKSGFLTPEEMQSRKLASLAKSGLEDRYFYTTFRLFDRVEVSATRYAVLTKGPRSVLLAASVDRRFAKDVQYPNQWRSMERDAAAQLAMGPTQPYSGAGFYVKVTRLARPVGTIFVEYHSVFCEPKGWFDGENLLRAKLPTIAQHEVTQFRGKWAKASVKKSP